MSQIRKVLYDIHILGIVSYSFWTKCVTIIDPPTLCDVSYSYWAICVTYSHCSIWVTFTTTTHTLWKLLWYECYYLSKIIAHIVQNCYEMSDSYWAKWAILSTSDFTYKVFDFSCLVLFLDFFYFICDLTLFEILTNLSRNLMIKTAF